MSNPEQDRLVVLAVVFFLGLIAVVGLAGGIFLIDRGAEISSIALVFAIPTTAVGALAGILASTRSNPSAPVQAQQAIGYGQAVADLKSITTPGDVSKPPLGG